MNEDLQFLQVTVWDILAQLQPDAQPKWGIMNAQNMVEHLRLPLQIAMGLGEFSPLFDEERTKKNYYYTITMRKPLPRNIKFQGDFLAKPEPLEFASIPDAIEALKESVQAFLAKFNAQPDLKTLHPVLGMLSFQDWLYFQRQHITHHCIQFGLLEDAQA